MGESFLSKRARVVIHFVNILVGAMTIANSAVALSDVLAGSPSFKDGFQPVVLQCYLILFGSFIMIMEVYSPLVILTSFAFYHGWGGRGLFHFFVGVISFADADLAQATFFINIITGSALFLIAQCALCSGFGMQMPLGLLNSAEDEEEQIPRPPSPSSSKSSRRASSSSSRSARRVDILPGAAVEEEPVSNQAGSVSGGKRSNDKTPSASAAAAAAAEKSKTDTKKKSPRPAAHADPELAAAEGDKPLKEVSTDAL